MIRTGFKYGCKDTENNKERVDIMDFNLELNPITN
jgi:hypothetical protein